LAQAWERANLLIFFSGAMPDDEIYRTLEIELEPGDVKFSAPAQKHALKRHPNDVPLIVPHLWWGRSAPLAVGFTYAPSRAGKHAVETLQNFGGVLQVDGYGPFGGIVATGLVIGIWTKCLRNAVWMPITPRFMVLSHGPSQMGELLSRSAINLFFLGYAAYWALYVHRKLME